MKLRELFQSRQRSDAELGILIMVGAILFVPFLDAIAKWLTASLAPGEIVWGRTIFQCIFLYPVLLLRQTHILKSLRRSHLFLGLFSAGTILFLVWGLQYLPLANNTALFFVEPLILTGISGLFLGERVTLKRWIAVAIGLVGALILIRPNWSAYGVAALLPFAAGTSYAIYMAILRIRSGQENLLTLQFWTGIFGCSTLSIALISGTALNIPGLQFTLPVYHFANALPWLAGLGLFSTIIHLFVAIALRKANASTLAPFQYLEIISSTILGWLVFGDFPDLLTAIGAGIIISSGLYVFMNERRIRNNALPPV